MFAALAILVLIGLFYFWNHQSTAGLTGESTSAGDDTSVIKTKDTDATTASASGDASAPSQKTNSVPLEDVQSLTEVEFKKWIQNESKTLNYPSVDAGKKQIQMKAVAQSLKPLQLKQLTELALNVAADANARIFSAYLLTQNSASENQTFLSDIAKKALPDLGPMSAHSVAEVKRGQELALRYMAIDELFIRAKTNPQALAEMQRLGSEAESVEVRNYVQRKLAELH